MRELERIRERSHVGPGSTEYLKPFASEIKNRMVFGSKTDYNKQDFFTPMRKKKEINTSVGPGSTEYAKPFGSNITHKMHFFGRKETKVSDVPPPGYYNPSSSITKPRTTAATIRLPKQYAIYD